VYVLGMDVGGTNCRLGLVDRTLQAQNVIVYPSKDIWSSDDSIESLAEVIRGYLKVYDSKDEVTAISIGFPSVVNKARTKLLSSTNFPGLDDVLIIDELSVRLGKKVIIDHDAYYLLLYDIEKSGIVNEGTIAGCYFGTGLGNAVYINGSPYYGKNGAACELGHIPIPGSDYPCSCGNKGCIEMFSCGKALERIQEQYFPETPINELFLKHSAEKVLTDFVDYIAVAVSTEVNILDPDYVFLGGGIIHMDNFPKEQLVSHIISHTRKPYPAENLNLLFSSAAPESGIIGAAAAAFRSL